MISRARRCEPIQFITEVRGIPSLYSISMKGRKLDLPRLATSRLIESIHEIHVTPTDDCQEFVYFRLRRKQ